MRSAGEVAGGREALLRTGDVEPDDARVPVAHRELGDLPRAGGVAHGGEQAADPRRPAVLRRARGAGGEALQHRGDDLVEVEAPLGVQLRGEPDLGVDDSVGRQVLGALGRDAVQRLGRLHHRDRVAERLQVPLQRAAVSGTEEPLGELTGIARRQ